MDNKNYDIFICYRRFDKEGNPMGRDKALIIALELSKNFSVFFDYNEIRDNKFGEIIIPAIKKCKAFILVLTKNVLNRCEDENDWVRKEIELAIENDCKIILVNPDDSFKGEWPKNMPVSISSIKGIHISDLDFGCLYKESFNKLIKDRIGPVLPVPDVETTSQFSKLVNSLYSALVMFRDSLSSGHQDNFNKSIETLQNCIKQLLSISEKYRYSNTEISNRAQSIIDQYNDLVGPYNEYSKSDKISKEAKLLEERLTKQFKKLLDTVVKFL